MIPETNILAAISDLWVEQFPEGNTTALPKGLIKRISMPAVTSKDAIVSGQYNTRINILWYDVNILGFDAKMESIITAMATITSDANIKNVSFDSRDDGYDPVTGWYVMNLEFIVKHYI